MDAPPLNIATRLSLFLLSAATLVFEISQTRLFSVAQFYHFAFMIVSAALLGIGASGTLLAISPRLGRDYPPRSLAILSLATGLSVLGAYLLTNWLPFDSFSLAVDRRQAWILVLHYIALTAPFFFSGMAVAILLAAYPQTAGQTYAVNLTGSAFGCLVALVAPNWLGGEGVVVLSSGLAALAALLCPLRPVNEANRRGRISIRLATICLLIFALLDAGLRLRTGTSYSWLDLHLSPYKSLSYAMQYPGAQILYRRWNNFSRLDVVRSPGIRSLPGLSYRYLQTPPPQDGLMVDGDELSPIVRPGADPEYTSYLPSALAFQLQPAARTLILEPRGGLDILTALAQGASQVTAVEANPLIVEAARVVYDDPRLQVIIESDRSYLRRAQSSYDVIVLSLANSYHPIQSGAYSLVEDYRYTVEAFQDALARLDPDGLLTVTRWLQDPPSESLRTFALAVTALETSGADPPAQIVAFRGYQTGTLLVKNIPFTPAELQAIRLYLAERGFDLTYAPDVRSEQTNRFNVLPDSIYYQAYTALLGAQPRQAFYAAYPFDVRPPTDDHPFFGHFFKWSQAPQILAGLGRTFQPFGGAGYLVILAFLLLALLMAAVLIILPLAFSKPALQAPRQGLLAPLCYFSLLGLAFLLVEMPLIQRFILYLGHPAYAFTTVLFSLLAFSGLGSQMSRRFPLRPTLVVLVILLLSAPVLLPRLFALTLGLSLSLRIALTILVLAPLGFLMGIPFPGGIRWLLDVAPPGESPGLRGERRQANPIPHIPWVWAANGAASVVSATLAALLALTFGFNWVLRIGALCYAAAWLTVLASPRRGLPQLPDR